MKRAALVLFLALLSLGLVAPATLGSTISAPSTHPRTNNCTSHDLHQLKVKTNNPEWGSYKLTIKSDPANCWIRARGEVYTIPATWQCWFTDSKGMDKVGQSQTLDPSWDICGATVLVPGVKGWAWTSWGYQVRIRVLGQLHWHYIQVGHRSVASATASTRTPNPTGSCTVADVKRIQIKANPDLGEYKMTIKKNPAGCWLRAKGFIRLDATYQACWFTSNKPIRAVGASESLDPLRLQTCPFYVTPGTYFWSGWGYNFRRNGKEIYKQTGHRSSPAVTTSLTVPASCSLTAHPLKTHLTADGLTTVEHVWILSNGCHVPMQAALRCVYPAPHGLKQYHNWYGSPTIKAVAHHHHPWSTVRCHKIGVDIGTIYRVGMRYETFDSHGKGTWHLVLQKP